MRTRKEARDGEDDVICSAGKSHLGKRKTRLMIPYQMRWELGDTRKWGSIRENDPAKWRK